ncbi:P-loop containing nucleoside triphosphate hydrolase protein [Suillus paluster]|uniref:P-loop containing nucleoside triphosphate hydrolase protein n=1 Tax=Suillus paluster TaxID=48578 RepID=UPI001B87D383|nr:P-loop containing nucleoside triphosphate hydrolase protein [Suillus paluster]KAG1723720.1 P-loop containing nucleoside triphosphate hydrolase protein [Suillus paluster]
MPIPPLVIFGPSGVGKGTLINRLLKEFPNAFGFSVSHTTRTPRPGEIDGKHYHFTNTDNFKFLISQGAFIEHAQFSGNFYGTSAQAVQDVTATGKRCILDIEVQGVQQIKQTPLHAIVVFVSPPSMTALSQRLRGRATDSEDAIQRRLAIARREIDYARQPGSVDYVIVNDDLDAAYQKFKRIANGELDATVDQMPPLDD